MQEFTSDGDISCKTSALGLLRQKNLFISHPKYIIILPTKKYGRVFKSFNLGNIKMMSTAIAKRRLYQKVHSSIAMVLGNRKSIQFTTVSYTHLTLPTILLV